MKTRHLFEARRLIKKRQLYLCCIFASSSDWFITFFASVMTGNNGYVYFPCNSYDICAFLCILQDASYASPVMSDTESGSVTLDAGSCNPSVCKTFD